MPQRLVYQSNFSSASSKRCTAQLVNTIQHKGSTPAGACASSASTAHSFKGPNLALSFGGLSLTSAKRTSRRATRAGNHPRPGAGALMRRLGPAVIAPQPLVAFLVLDRALFAAVFLAKLLRLPRPTL